MQTVKLDSSAFGSYSLQIKGESTYQDEIKEIILYDEDGTHQSIQEDSLTAELIFEDDNPYEKGNAIRVEIQRRTVGYLSRDDAIKYRLALASKNLTGTAGACYAAVIGKYSDELGGMLFGVRLDLDLDNPVVLSASTSPAKQTQPSAPVNSKAVIPLIPMNGKGCLYFLFVLPFIVVINLYILLFAGLWHGGKALWKVGNASPLNRKISLGVIGTMSVMAVVSSFSGGSGSPTPPTPTLDLIAIQGTALAQAWLSFTQTAQAAVTATPLPTATLASTETATLAPLPTATTFLQALPINQSPTSPPAGQPAVCPCAGDTLNCGDFSTHSSAQACFNYCQSQGVGDIHSLDRDRNGLACESLP